jgi:hypothetical protein
MRSLPDRSLTEEGEPMTQGKILAVALSIGGLLLGASAGSNATSMQAHQTTTPTATGFRSLPPPPPIVGYPPQIYMNMLPPRVVSPSFGPSFGFSDRERHHDFHHFERAFENSHDH